MKRVDRLYIQALVAYGKQGKQVSIGFVDFMTEGEYKGKYRSRADLWDGREGTFRPEDSIYSYHDTKEEAIKAIEIVAEEHKPIGGKTNIEDIPILIMDYGELEEYAC